MILSVSRRTDIPNYYSEWFYNRIKEGFVYVRNPMNEHQISKVDVSPAVVDCIVFWTKNPEPMIHRLDELSAYSYYFQFTLTGYGKDIECNVPHKREKMIPVFQKLSNQIGSCAEKIDLAECGIEHNYCIDQKLIEDLIGCKYCYANHSQDSVIKTCCKYDLMSPLLCGMLNEEDKISQRKVKSLREEQLSFFDL